MSAARAALLGLGLAASGVGCGSSGPWAEGAGRTSVVAERTDLTVDLVAQGELEARSASPIAVPRVPTGALKIKELVEEGTLIAEGDVVVVFDRTQLDIELDNHRASFRSTARRIDGTQLSATIEADAIGVMKEVAQLERDHLEAFELADASIYSRREILEDEVRLDTAVETILFADASLLLRGESYDIEERILGVEREQVEGKIDRTEFSLGNLVLKAPIGGLVVYRKNWQGSSVNVGDTLWPGNVIVSIVDPGSTALKAYVLERDAAGLAEGASATVTIDAWPELSLAGRVAHVAELSRPIDSGSPVKFFEVSIELLDPPASFKPGMKGAARIVTAELQNVVVVPRSAVHESGDVPFVVVRSASGLERRSVQLGAGDLVRVSVEAGLVGGEELLLGDDLGKAAAAAAPAQTADHGG